MSKNKSMSYVLVGAVSLAFLASLLTAIKARSQQGDSHTTTRNIQQTEKNADDAATPIVNFEDARNITPAQNSPRSLKNARYNKSGLVIKQPSASTGDIRIYSDPKTPASDLPVDESDIILEGEVVGAEAFLSADQSGVYSEFTVRVSRILKVRHGLSVDDNNTIVTERFGGKVRYPSGKIVRYRIAGEGSPIKGAKYLFFLKQAVAGNYNILTAYELRGNKVIVLDGSSINVRGQGQTIFDKHNGKDLSVFMDELERAVRNSTSQTGLTEASPNE